MVGIVLVSHSKPLAKATEALMRSMTQGEVSVALAAGAGEDGGELGTDATQIFSAIESVYSPDGVVVLMDMGSAILSTEMALEFLTEDQRKKVRISPAPFVEGAVAAGVSAMVGNDLERVFEESTGGLRQKMEHLGGEDKEREKESSLEGAVVRDVIVPNPHGLHARPVAELIKQAATYKSEIQIRNKTKNKGPVSVLSMTGIIALEALQGNTVELRATGEDAESALQELVTAIESGLGDKLNTATGNVEDLDTEKAEEKNTHHPVGLGGGLVIGHPVFYMEKSIEVPVRRIETIEQEIDRFEKALEETIKGLREQGAREKIFEAQAITLKDPVLKERTRAKIKNQKQDAASAWWEVAQETITQYRGLSDANLQQRAQDVKDAAIGVLENLGIQVQENTEFLKDGIWIAEDLTPKQVMDLDTEKVKGVICFQNGPTSHSAILLISRGIPAIIQAGTYADDLKTHRESLLIMDADSGEIRIDPSPEIVEKAKGQIGEQEEQRREAREKSRLPARTKDGWEIPVLANVARAEDAELALKNGAEGIGLLRTEFMFIDRDQAPTEEEQVGILRGILEPLKGKPCVIRTLDAGGDKNIPYLNIAREENPFLGVRAIRLSLRHPELFKAQLRAILRVSTDFEVQLMFPMIALPKELESAKSMLEKAHLELEKEGRLHPWPIKTGMMMEVPSAALLADEFARLVDFFSIGTNDLVQYTMAADRGNTALQESLGKGLSPAVLRLIKNITERAKAQGIPVAVCGETASHPEWAGLLLGLGVSELSMNPARIPEIKEWIRNQDLSKLKKEVLQKI